MKKSLCVLAVALLGLGGCQKLNVEGTTEVEIAGTKRIEFDAPAYNQAIRVTIDPESSSVSAYLVKTADAEAAENKVSPGKPPPKEMVLAGKTFQRTDSRQDFILEATIPAKTPYTLLISGGSKRTKVKYKVVGR